jgi:hypothetical protein
MVLEGDPVELVNDAAKEHDVIVIGRDSDFRGEGGAGLAAAVEQILKQNPRPLIPHFSHAVCKLHRCGQFDCCIILIRRPRPICRILNARFPRRPWQCCWGYVACGVWFVRLSRR